MIQTIIFDLDGTLVDTEIAAARAIKDCFRNWGLSIDHEDSSFFTGRKWEVVTEYLFKKYKFPIDRETAENTMVEAFQKAVNESLPIVPGAKEAIVALSSKYKLGLVSGSYRSEILFALDHMNVRSHFQVILGAEDYGESKPSPQGYILGMKMLKTEPRDTLVFEDSFVGITSARLAGAWVIAITGTNHFKQALDQAHHKIPDFVGINPNWVAQLKLG